MKQCTQCSLTKDYNEFSKDSANKDGLRFCCKECDKIRRIKNKEKNKLYGLKYRANNREILAQKQALYYKDNKERVKATKQKYIDNHYLKVLDTQKKYRSSTEAKILKNNREAIRRAKVIDKINPLDWINLCNYYGDYCPYCFVSFYVGPIKRHPESKTIDHFVPLSKNCKNVIENVIPCCLKCNISKRDSSFIIWLTKSISVFG